MIDTISTGKIIAKLRNDKKLTQEELAEKIDISKNYLSKVERGLSKLNVETFFKMAEVLSFSLEDFGIKYKQAKQNTQKEELIKMILSASNKEIEIYLKSLKLIHEIINQKN